MPQSLADFDSQYLSSSQRKGLSFLPTSKRSKIQDHRQQYPHLQQHQQQRSSLVQALPFSQNTAERRKGHRHQESSASFTSSAATSRSSTTTSMSSRPASGPMSVREATMKAQEIHITSDVAEWAHQMHITQRRSYWWCQACFPKELAEPLRIPKAVENVVTGRQLRMNEPSHCYEI